MGKLIKRFFYFIAIMALIGVIGGIVLSRMPPLPLLTRAFFTAIEHKNYEVGYQLMSSQFKNNTDIYGFVGLLERTHLLTAKEWEEQSNQLNQEQKVGRIIGFVTVVVNNEPKRIPIELRFVHEEMNAYEASWKINSIVVQPLD